MPTIEDARTEDARTEQGPDRGDRVAPSRKARAWAGLVPGAAVCAAITVPATALGRLVPVVGAPVIAILCGMVLAQVAPPSVRLRPGIAFVSKAVLQASVVVLGFGLSLRQVVGVGRGSLPVLVGTLVAALAMAAAAGRLLRLPVDQRTLIGVGTAICGASAIAATDAVIGADEADVSYAIATIFTFNVIAVLTYPTLGHALGFSSHAFGLWAGTAVNDLSSVVAASTIYGHGAATYAVIVKLTRTLAIVPISLGLAAVAGRRSRGAGRPAGRRSIELRRVIPLFIVAFVVAAAVNTVGLVPAGAHHTLATLATWMITAALAAIGLSTDFGRIRRAGLRPLALGGVLWLTVGLVSLGLQAMTGSL